MTKRGFAFFCAVLLAGISLGFAQDAKAPAAAAGEWDWKMDTPQGEVGARLVLAVDGNKLTGKFHFGEDRVLEISEGTVDDGNLTFKVKRNRQDGGVMIYSLKGVVSGDGMKGTAETEMDGQTAKIEWTATRKR